MSTTMNPPTCMGCMLPHNFVMPIKSEFSYADFDKKPKQIITYEELGVLASLKEAWDKFLALGGHLDHDMHEFNYAIHLAQQKIAVRVARRADPIFWRQNDVENSNIGNDENVG